jgi:hypothetical protein
MMNLMNKDYTWVDGYATQYLDILNCRFLDMSREKRLKSIPTNPYSKEVPSDKLFINQDLLELESRLKYLQNTRGIGLVAGEPL